MPALKPCATVGCPSLVPRGTTYCQPHARAVDLSRGTAKDRGYNTPGHRAFREQVLARNPVCVLCRRARATVADHYPLSRKDLEAVGLDPNDPSRGRGLCARCHSHYTATTPDQQGGWNDRRY